MSARPTRNDRGFTLVELLVVIIIIGILAAIAVPVYLNQRQRAYEAGVRADLRNAAVAMHTYFSDHTWSELRTAAGIAGAETSLVVAGTPVAAWASVPDAPTIPVSDAETRIFLGGTTSPAEGWSGVTPEGEFCLRATSPKIARYAYSFDGIAGPPNYERIGFYDSTIGGVTDIRAIARAIRDGQEPACGLFGYRWIDAVADPY